MIGLRRDPVSPVELRKTISVSAAKTAMQCGWRHHLRYVLREPEPFTGSALVIGIVIDHLVKLVVAGVQAGDMKPGDIDTDGLFDAEWQKEEESRTVPIRWGKVGRETSRDTALRVFKAFCDLPDLEERISTIVAADLRFEMVLRDPVHDVIVPGVTVVGVLDFVQELPNSTVRMLEIKTAASRSNWAGDLSQDLQAAVYQTALRDQYGPDAVAPSAAWWVGLKLKKAEWIDREAEIPESSERRALLTLRHVVHAVASGANRYPQVNTFCTTCPWHDHPLCRDWQDREQSRVPVDVFATDVLAAELSTS